MRRILISGAGGFIAGRVARVMKREGCRVLGTSRRAEPIEDFDCVYQLALMESLAKIFDQEEIDVMIHCANYTGTNEFEINVAGTTRWLEEARKYGVKMQIFLSSLSAREKALSDYGRAKYELEQHFLSIDGIVLRLGLVIGNGGMFEKLKQTIRAFPVIPLLDNGTSKVYVLGTAFLCSLIRDSIFKDGDGLGHKIWHVQQPQPVTLRDVMEGIRKHYGYKCIFFPVPSLPVLWGITILESLPFLKLPIGSTNLKGLRQSRNESFPSDFRRFGYSEQSLDELIGEVTRSG